jgi:hypothetical protein
MRFVASLVAAALAAVAAVEASQASNELASEASAQGTTFVSKRYGYEFALIGRFFPQYATVAWSGSFPFGGRADIDGFYDWKDRKFIIAAKRLPAGATLRSWQVAQVATKEAFCAKSQAFRNSTLGGEPAREYLNVCPGYDVITLVALHRGLGYMFSFVSPTQNAAASDRRIYDAARRSFRFSPK